MLALRRSNKANVAWNPNMPLSTPEGAPAAELAGRGASITWKDLPPGRLCINRKLKPWPSGTLVYVKVSQFQTRGHYNLRAKWEADVVRAYLLCCSWSPMVNKLLNQKTYFSLSNHFLKRLPPSTLPRLWAAHCRARLGSGSGLSHMATEHTSSYSSWDQYQRDENAMQLHKNLQGSV